jgi:hypothetical protein
MTLSAKRYFTPSLAVIKESARMDPYKKSRRTLNVKEKIMAINSDSTTVIWYGIFGAAGVVLH